MYLNGVQFTEDNAKYSVIYDTNMVKHILPQEKGFTHYISGEFITVNQFFIENDTVNALTSLANMSPSEKSFITATNARKVQARNNQISQGVLETLKGSDNNVNIG
jgi:hypothetical protein